MTQGESGVGRRARGEVSREQGGGGGEGGAVGCEMGE